MNGSPEVGVVVTCYNEAPVISGVLEELCRFPYRIVVVDDGSTDESAERISAHPVTLLRHPCNLGQGAALQTGITHAVSLPQTRYVVTFDGDGQHRAEDIDAILEPLRGSRCDVALGTRFHPSARPQGMTRGRRTLLHLAVRFTRLTTRLPLSDTHNGLRGFTAEAARRIRITQNRMAHASEILAQIAALGLRVEEVPVVLRYSDYSRHKGQKWSDGLNIMWDVVSERVR